MHIHSSYMTTLISDEAPSAVEPVVDSKTSSAAVPYSIPSSDDNQLVASGKIDWLNIIMKPYCKCREKFFKKTSQL